MGRAARRPPHTPQQRVRDGADIPPCRQRTNCSSARRPPPSTATHKVPSRPSLARACRSVRMAQKDASAFR
ncbi:hypothetical protein CALVIDRAFT_405133 [Calocera viscosa TUFC12733]|uniref:Uncharacterized protein n=1 Tax=Calocera viscosa (strain TUFC12733) TaxID=1330018 RepID=A0A167PX05_CALVF|nr:hypothetical protein CALVIDRAFT_405133 [Calocera viscosa TUFC12733]